MPGIKMKWPLLTWRKAPSQAKTYHAKRGNRSYTIDHDGRTWSLRGWYDGEFKVYEHDIRVSEMQRLADDDAKHATVDEQPAPADDEGGAPRS